VQALEDTSLDSDQLRRGRRYANSGQVGTITVSPGRIAATVYAPEDTYEAVVHVDELTADDWWRFLDQVAARAGHIAALLDGEMPHDLVEAAADAGVTLLPGIGDLDPSCTCDAWELPCQHAAALCYQTAWLLDADPFVLLLLRGRSRESLLDQLQTWTHPTPDRTTSSNAKSAPTQTSAKPPAGPTPTVGSAATSTGPTTTDAASAPSAASSAATGAASDVAGVGASAPVGAAAVPGAGSTAEGDGPAAPVDRSAMPRAGSAAPGAGPEATRAGSAASVEGPALPGASSAVASATPEATSARSGTSIGGSAAPGAGSAVPSARPETMSAGSGVLEGGSAAPGAGSTVSGTGPPEATSAGSGILEGESASPGAGSTVSGTGPEAASAGSGASAGGSAVPGDGPAVSGAGSAGSGHRPAARGAEAAGSVAGSASGEALSTGVSVADVFAGQVGELPPPPGLPAKVGVEELAVSGIEAPEGLGPAVLQLLVLDASRRARALLSALLHSTPEPEPLDEWQDGVRLAADFPELTTPLAEATGQSEELALGIQAWRYGAAAGLDVLEHTWTPDSAELNRTGLSSSGLG
jgi:uncharacterized Zn finger protein